MRATLAAAVAVAVAVAHCVHVPVRMRVRRCVLVYVFSMWLSRIACVALPCGFHGHE